MIINTESGAGWDQAAGMIEKAENWNGQKWNLLMELNCRMFILCFNNVIVFV